MRNIVIPLLATLFLVIGCGDDDNRSTYTPTTYSNPPNPNPNPPLPPPPNPVPPNPTPPTSPGPIPPTPTPPTPPPPTPAPPSFPTPIPPTPIPPAPMPPAPVPPTPPSPTPIPPRTPVESSAPSAIWRYKLNGKDRYEKDCSTGLKSFKSLESMCINIQDPVQNNDCALDERIKKFNKECIPEGFDFNESHVCKISLLDKDAEIERFGEFDKKFLIKSITFCAGRTKRGKLVNEKFHDSNFIHDNIFARVDMGFVPRRSSYADHLSYFNMSLNKRVDDLSFQPLNINFTYNDGDKIEYGSIGDNKHKFIINCANTWACDDIISENIGER